MAEIIIMPKLGFNMSSGKLVRWYKNEGDAVKKGEPLFAIETDKTSIDIEATADGVLRKKLIEEGDSSEVTLPIAIIGTASEDIGSLLSEMVKPLDKGDSVGAFSDATAPDTLAANITSCAPTAHAQDNAALQAGEMKITPRARRTAKEKGLSLESLHIQGTGYQGGICEKDILLYLESNHFKATPVAQNIAQKHGLDLSAVSGSGFGGKIMKDDALAAIKQAEAQQEAAGFDPAAVSSEKAELRQTADGKRILEEIPYTGVRKIIGDRLSESKFTAPHLYFTQVVDIAKLMELRKTINAAQETKTSVTDYIARATIKTLQKYPEMNSSLIENKLLRYKDVNLGIAVAAPTGLIVPVVTNAQDRSIPQLSKEASALFEKARNGKLTPAEYTGGTFTISNLGMFGIENFTAIINPPEVGILAISATHDRPSVETDADGNKTIAIKPLMNITLSVDHRVIDGLLAAQFVTEVKRLLENPIELLI